jgi:nitrate reductase gamma subunit
MMSDEFLFIVAPGLSLALLVSLSLCCALRRQPERGGEETERTAGARTIWRWAIAIVLAGHLLAFAFPAGVLAWNRQPLRLFILEGTGLAAGIVALFGLTTVLVRRALDNRDAPSPAEVVAGTFICIEVVSGLAVAVFYRWGSSWSVVTLGPYLLSLVRLEPAVRLVADMPFPVRLHVFCAFAVVASLPFTRLAGTVISSLTRRIHSTVARAALAGAAVPRGIQMRSTKHLQVALSMFSVDHEREN